MLRYVIASLLLVLLAACSRAPLPEAKVPATDPELLSGWGILSRDGHQLRLSHNVVSYGLTSTLFTDYAHKLRTIWVPEGSQADVASDGTVLFPVGTIISKTFYYPKDDSGFVKTADRHQHLNTKTDVPYLDLSQVELIETRLLVHRESGWVALPYVWNQQQTDATLEITGAVMKATLTSEGSSETFPYIVPDQNQCGGCHIPEHSSRALSPIGPKLRHLDRPAPHSQDNQISQWMALHILPSDLPDYSVNVDYRDKHADLEARARAYLDINCGHCHSPVGPADTSGLYLDALTQDRVRIGLCKAPIAAGQGTGGNQFSIVPGEPEHSILVYRMASLDPGAMMPELGRSLVHQEGVELISDWIRTMEGECEPMGHVPAE